MLRFQTMSERRISMKVFCLKRKGCRFFFLSWLIVSFLGTNLLLPRNSIAITRGDEETVGREILDLVRMRLSLVEDGEVLTYVQAVGNRIVKELGPAPYQYQFFVINQSVPNAFAVPGGYIFIYRGLIEMMASEGELAGILSHELGHIQARHYQRRAEQSRILNVASLAGVLAAILIGAKSGGGAGTQALAMGSLAGAQTLELQYSRENEEEADQLGLRYLCSAGYPAKDMVSVMQRMNQAQWMVNSNIPSYLSTHPALTERIQYLQDLIQKPEYQTKSKNSSNLGDFSIMQASLVAEYAEPKAAQDRFLAGIRRGDVAATYGLGRLYLRQGRAAEALPYLQDAVRQDSGSPFILSTLGDAYLKLGKLNEAQRVLQTALLLDPSSPVVHYRLALVLKDLGQREEALQHFQRIEEWAPAFPDIDNNLGILFGQMNQMGLAHFHLGRYYLHKHRWDLAVFHYKKAKALITDSPQKLQEIDRGLKEAEKHMKDKGMRGGKR
jgi:beta-barrel assembly-enhancing protease